MREAEEATLTISAALQNETARKRAIVVNKDELFARETAFGSMMISKSGKSCWANRPASAHRPPPGAAAEGPLITA
jgi:hypothetical protein